MFSSMRIRILLSIVTITLTTTLILMSLSQNEIRKSMIAIDEESAINLLHLTMMNVENGYKSLLFHERSILEHRKSELKNIVTIAILNIDSFYLKSKKGIISEAEAKQQAIEEIKKIRYDNGVGYIWINDTGLPFPKMIMHPTIPSLDGKVLDARQYNCANDSNDNLFQTFVMVCNKDGEGFVDYLWPKPTKNGLTKKQSKISYVKLFKEWGWIIGTGVYVDEIEKESLKRRNAILQDLRGSFSKIRIGETGYMFLFNSQNKMLIHPAYEGKNFSSLINYSTGNRIIDDLVTTAKSKQKKLEYLWDKPPKYKGQYRFEKIAFIDYFEPLDWYISSSVYKDEIMRSSIILRNKISVLVIVFLLISIILSILLSKSLSEPLLRLTDSIKQIDITGNSKANIPIVGTSETRNLGMFLDKMIKSIRKTTLEKDLLFVDLKNKNKELTKVNEQILKEIKERKLAEEQILRLATAVDQADETIIISDNKGDIQYVNPAFEKTTLYSLNEVMGKNISILKGNEHKIDFYKDINKSISSGNSWRGHMICIRKNGTKYDIEATISPIKNISGEITNYVSVQRDITQELKQEEQIRTSQKMDSLGTLAAGIAHDFNNILSAIIGYTELAVDDSINNPQLNNHMIQVLTAANRAKDLVHQILAFSRQTEQVKKPVKITPIIKEVCKFLRASLPSTIEINYEIKTDNDVLMAEPTQLHQVFMNLCTNAWHAMKEKGGVLNILLEEVTLDEVILTNISPLNNNGFLKMSISDTGCGIENNVLDRIFEPYFTTKTKEEGTGLGLAVVHGIVESYNGTIKVYSESGKGTMFALMFPLINQKEIVLTDQQKINSMGTETILFIDDEISLVNIGKAMLERLGYRVFIETNPEEALNIFKNNKDKIDLIITDKTMPQIAGFDLARSAKEIRRDIPVILYTGFKDKNDSAKADEVGIQAFILKPLNKHHLSEIIRSVLDKKE